MNKKYTNELIVNNKSYRILEIAPYNNSKKRSDKDLDLLPSFNIMETDKEEIIFPKLILKIDTYNNSLPKNLEMKISCGGDGLKKYNGVYKENLPLRKIIENDTCIVLCNIKDIKINVDKSIHMVGGIIKNKDFPNGFDGIMTWKTTE